jgi:hypothetical protein
MLLSHKILQKKKIIWKVKITKIKCKTALNNLKGARFRMCLYKCQITKMDACGLTKAKNMENSK